jgi:AraC-like DNA-binding protein
MLTWAKLLHAGRWLTDPGRSAQSISRQLEYSSGAAFRRALRSYGGLTPTQVRERGGLAPVLERFLDACGLLDSVELGRSVA